MKVYLEVNVPDGWERSFDMQQTIEAEIGADRWAWHEADNLGPLAPLQDENRALRQLLAERVAGALLYADDGELQDNTQTPRIDFARDTPNEIQRKLQERGRANYLRSLEDDARGIGA